ncbi:10151_t:CDS:1, partial [Scutellospora calospora]
LNTYKTFSKLLNQSDWGMQKYQHGQETQVVLVGELFEESSKQMQPQKTKDKCNKKDTSQLTIE